MKTEVLNKLKELKDVSRGLYIQLEEDGMKVSDPQAGLAREQFFQNNMKHIVNGIEGLMRGEASEKHMVRLDKEFPNAMENLRKLKGTPVGVKNAGSLNRVEGLVTFLENNYRAL